jgi:hypothetical protein
MGRAPVVVCDNSVSQLMSRLFALSVHKRTAAVQAAKGARPSASGAQHPHAATHSRAMEDGNRTRPAGQTLQPHAAPAAPKAPAPSAALASSSLPLRSAHPSRPTGAAEEITCVRTAAAAAAAAGGGVERRGRRSQRAGGGHDGQQERVARRAGGHLRSTLPYPGTPLYRRMRSGSSTSGLKGAIGIRRRTSNEPHS